MTSQERHEARYQRRKAARLQKKIERSTAVGDIKDVYNFEDTFKYGLACCKNVRWKSSVQEFEAYLFSETAHRINTVINNTWAPDKYVHFTINERGKTRPIDAPRIQDRQINKVFTKKVLLPLYYPNMIYNNGASLEGKGFHFSINELKKDLSKHYKKYDKNG